MGLLVLNEQFAAVSVEIIREAEKEICLSSFKIELSDKPLARPLKSIFEALIEKAKNGVKVRILFNWKPNGKSVPRTNFVTANTLKKNGIELKYLPNDRCCHAKIIIADKKRAILGSHNLSVKSLTENFEVSYLLPDPESVAELQQIFDYHFSKGKEI